MSKHADYVKKAHQLQLKRGWRRLGLRLPPEAAMDLAREEIRTGQSPTNIIVELLKKTRPQ